MITDAPAVPAPARRSGEDHAEQRTALCFAGGVLHLNTGGKSRLFIGDSDVAVDYDEDGNAYVELDRTEIEFLRDKLNAYLPVSRDSGEAVRRAQAWPGDDLRQDVLLANGTDLAADVLALFASTARLTEDNKRLRKQIEAHREEKYGPPDAEAWHKEPEDIELYAALFPTASPPEGQDWSGMTTREISAEEWAAQADGNAPADGAED